MTCCWRWGKIGRGGSNAAPAKLFAEAHRDERLGEAVGEVRGVGPRRRVGRPRAGEQVVELGRRVREGRRAQAPTDDLFRVLLGAEVAERLSS